MKNLLFTALIGATLFWGACNSANKSASTTKQSAMENSDITGIRWRLIELNGKPVPAKINDKEPFILLQDSTNRYSASAGCNVLGGTFTLQGNGRIKFSEGISTMMACPDMEEETAFKEVLKMADNYTVSGGGDTLSLNKARMAPLARFQAMQDDETGDTTQ